MTKTLIKFIYYRQYLNQYCHIDFNFSYNCYSSHLLLKIYWRLKWNPLHRRYNRTYLICYFGNCTNSGRFSCGQTWTKKTNIHHDLCCQHNIFFVRHLAQLAILPNTPHSSEHLSHLSTCTPSSGSWLHTPRKERTKFLHNQPTPLYINPFTHNRWPSGTTIWPSSRRPNRLYHRNNSLPHSSNLKNQIQRNHQNHVSRKSSYRSN